MIQIAFIGRFAKFDASGDGVPAHARAERRQVSGAKMTSNERAHFLSSKCDVSTTARITREGVSGEHERGRRRPTHPPAGSRQIRCRRQWEKGARRDAALAARRIRGTTFLVVVIARIQQTSVGRHNSKAQHRTKETSRVLIDHLQDVNIGSINRDSG